MMDEDLKSALSTHFPEFTETDFKKELIEECNIRHIPAGNPLVEMGQQIRSIPLVIHGKVKIFREDEDGHELFLYYLEAGDACAISFSCTLHDNISKVKAVAVEDTDVISIPVRLMPHWMSVYRSWYRFVIDTYNDRFDELLAALDSIAFHRLDERLVDYLEKNRKALETNILHLSHQEIAFELNTSREVISRLLKKLEQKGAVKIGRSKLEILDLELA
jgi:CRP/FNR family transcriptional regulator